MTSPDTDLADAVRRIRERVLRQAMAAANQVRIQTDAYEIHGVDGQEGKQGFRIGHAYARRQIYDALERMIAKEAPKEVPVSVTQAGSECTLREVMDWVRRMEKPPDDLGLPFKRGYDSARRQIFEEMERKTGRGAFQSRQAGYTSDGLED